jgi:tetratricopeptide (TPR) repeat protein
VDTIFALARAVEALKQWEPAVRLLAEAARLDPNRADVQQLLALTASELGAFDDALAAWDRYLKLAPDDEAGRRERSYTAIQMGQLEQGTAGLEWFIARHPGDAIGRYELGRAAERSLDMTKARAHFDKALELDPNYVPARTARGSLFYQEGNPEAALKDLEAADSLRPGDAGNLDRLGQTYQALDRPANAVRVLRRATELAPENSTTLLHFARALADAGKMDESKAMMDRFRQLGPEKHTEVPPGFVEYLSLTDEQRHADYRARVEKALLSHPEDPAAHLAWLRLLVADHASDSQSDEVIKAARALAVLKPGATVLAGAGHTLLGARRYEIATELLTQAAAAAQSTELAAGIELELALATLGAGNPPRALELLDKTPASVRNADYYLARAEILSASGKSEESAAAADQALGSAPGGADFYLQAAAFLLQTRREPEALRFLDKAVRELPQNREILLSKAAVLELLRRTGEAERLFGEIENRWPEWYAGWAAHGIALRTNNHTEDARRALDTAVALGIPADLLNLDLRIFLDSLIERVFQ